ncbi:hypothetical protein SAMN05216567_11098 [Variovorax sp. OK605]|jgi:hypothetical protein|nr:hypothetical protein SAMN05216567_11098 [Variovorax sp. OK605]
MDRRKFSLTMVGAAVLAGCGGGGGGASGFAFPPIAAAPPAEPPPAAPPAPPEVVPEVPVVPAGPELATPTALPAGVAFLQTIAATDSGGAQAPGQANVWDLNLDFSLEDGGDDQFDTALALSVKVGASTDVFPSDQLYAELTALGPELGAADGQLLVSFTSDPGFSGVGTGGYALLHPGTQVRLQQTLNLGTATGGISMSWVGNRSFGNRYLGSLRDDTIFGQVVVRDTAGAILATLYKLDVNGETGTWGSASLTSFAGQTVVLSFEQRVVVSGMVIDNVSVQDGSSHEFVVNGDFEAQGTGWTVSASKMSQNVRSGVRTAGGLEVQRTFYTQPNVLWGRFTDVFHNPSAAAIVAEVAYASDLGSDSSGIIYPTPGATSKALTTWDGSPGDRDVGFVFGAADSVTYLSATALHTPDGDDALMFKFNITVPAGGSVTLVNFLLTDGTDTGRTAADVNARATAIDTVAADIANNFKTNFAYQRGLTQAQLDTLKNL